MNLEGLIEGIGKIPGVKGARVMHQYQAYAPDFGGQSLVCQLNVYLEVEEDGPPDLGIHVKEGMQVKDEVR